MPREWDAQRCCEHDEEAVKCVAVLRVARARDARPSLMEVEADPVCVCVYACVCAPVDSIGVEGGDHRLCLGTTHSFVCNA